ncbi:MAG: DedA family protein [Euzebyales bacterium]|nr:DedA family protein [Euzebyales bacterium]
MSWVTDLATRAGGLGLAAVMLIENLFPPIPSEAVLPFAGFLVGRGDLGLVPAMLGSTLGSAAGALVLYAIGRFGGRVVLLRHGHLFRLSERDLDRADEWFDRHGGKVVFFARMVPLVRSVVSVPAGTSQMPVGRFLVLTAAGSGVWNALLIGFGVALGENYVRVAGVVAAGSNVVVGVLAVTAVTAVAWWYRSRSRRRREVSPSDE